MPLTENGSSDTSSRKTHDSPLSEIENTRMSQEAKLFHSLNGFISLVSNEGSRSGEHLARHKSFEDTKVDSKYVSNFLRLNLLSYLRQLQQYTRRQTPHRQVLIQWWVTLLNFLNSDIVMNSPNSESDSHLSFPDPHLTMDTISVSLECVSRLLSTLMVLPIDDYRETEIFSHHVLLTIHYVTNRLILNSKHSNHLGKVQPPNNRPFLHFLNSYTALLRSFLGKLNAYAFFYLPDDFHYDTQLLVSIISNLTFKASSDSLFPWKRRKFVTTEEADGRVNPDDLENKDTRFFKIIISYMRNDSIFMAFYWHYWYIVLRFISFSETPSNIESSLDRISGASPLMTHVTSSYLKADLNKLTRLLKSAHLNKASPNSNFNSSDTMPDATATANTNDSTITTEMFNDFVFSNFRILRLWECLRCLSGCFLQDPNLSVLLSLHDSFQLSYISSVPAYDCNAANVVYNKILQFIIFQYKSIPTVQFLNWDIWSIGILGMLKTLNSNCQITALMCLFNIWNFLPSSIQKKITSGLIDELWSSLTLENEFELAKIIFLKLLVFHIIPTSDYSIREALKIKFQHLYEEMLSIKANIGEEPNMETGDIFSFYGNKRFFLSPNKPTEEADLIYRVERQSRLKVKTKSQNFPSVASVANIRPSFVLKNGRYPYDVFDEMVTKAALLLAEKKRKEAESPLPAVRDATLNIAEQANHGVERNPKRLSSLSNTIGSWFSKLSMDADQASSSPETSKHTGSGIMNMRKKRVKSATSDVNISVSESTETLSMYSNVSSLATGKTNSSDEQIGKSNKQVSEAGSKTPTHREASSDDSRIRNEQLRKKKKLLAPVELKYSIGVIEDAQISTLFKVMIISGESITSRIEQANVGWSVATARTYDKPLPIPGDPGVDSFIEKINCDSYDLETFNESKFEYQNLQQTTEQPQATSKNSSANARSIPIPNYNILGNVSDKESLIEASSSPLVCNNSDMDEVAEKAGATSRHPGYDTNEDKERMARRVVLKHNKVMHLKTRINKIAQLVRMFNKTIEEYYEYLNFLDHESLFMEFEVRIPAHSLNLINIDGEQWTRKL